ncbi:hypothetical protein TNCV_3972031 [Trichonephila clavipes]|nr:hypothetical protein TNCV_3972031 [Trichonephila clavipes]
MRLYFHRGGFAGVRTRARGYDRYLLNYRSHFASTVRCIDPVRLQQCCRRDVRVTGIGRAFFSIASFVVKRRRSTVLWHCHSNWERWLRCVLSPW